jgi:excisionase family DNA binding protein
MNETGGKEIYMTIEEVAVYLRLAEQTIRRWVLNREIPFHKIRKVIRFRLSEIEKWIDGGGGDTAMTGDVGIEGDLFAGTEAEIESGAAGGAEEGGLDGEAGGGQDGESGNEVEGGMETDNTGADETGEGTEYNGSSGGAA